jgi:hypothetical protein
MTENQRGCLVLHTTLGGVRGGSNAARRQDIQIPAGVACTTPQTVDLPPVSQTIRCALGSGVGLLDSGHATGWIWRARSSYLIGVSLPGGIGDGRTGFAETGPGVPGAGDGARHPRCGRPGGLTVGEASRIPRGLGQAGRHSGRVDRLTAENSQHHHDSRAAPVVTIQHQENSGRPISKRDRVPGRARPRPGVRSSRPRWPNGESSTRRAVSRPRRLRPRGVP